MQNALSPATEASSDASSDIFDGLQEEKLEDVLKDYICILAERYPFSLDLKIDERYVVSQLAELWPEDAEWMAQAYEVWERIDAIIHSIPGITGTPEAFLRLSAASTPLVPNDLPDPDEIAAVATFDSIRGVLRHGLLLPTKNVAADLEAFLIPSGLMLICQPLVRVSALTTDMRESGLGAGTNIYAERDRDSTAPQDDGSQNPAITYKTTVPPQNNQSTSARNNSDHVAQDSSSATTEKEVVHAPLPEPMRPPQPS